MSEMSIAPLSNTPLLVCIGGAALRQLSLLIERMAAHDAFPDARIVSLHGQNPHSGHGLDDCPLLADGDGTSAMYSREEQLLSEAEGRPVFLQAALGGRSGRYSMLLSQQLALAGHQQVTGFFTLPFAKEDIDGYRLAVARLQLERLQRYCQQVHLISHDIAALRLGRDSDLVSAVDAADANLVQKLLGSWLNVSAQAQVS